MALFYWRRDHDVRRDHDLRRDHDAGATDSLNCRITRMGRIAPIPIRVIRVIRVIRQFRSTWPRRLEAESRNLGTSPR